MLRDRLREWGLNDKNVRRKSSTRETTPVVVYQRRRSSVNTTRHKSPAGCNLDSLATVKRGCPGAPSMPLLAEESTHRALRAVACFLDVCCKDCDQQTTATDPMWELMRDYWQGFYFMDIGDTIQGMNILRSVGPRVRDALQSRHPAALLHPLQTLYTCKVSKKERSRLSGMPQRLREAVMVDGRLRVIKCLWCDDTITAAHFHCPQCPQDYSDICADCASSGRHCPDSTHVVQQRFIEADTVIEHTNHAWDARRTSITGVCSEAETYKERKLISATARQTSNDVMPVITSFLLQESMNMHGPEHPMTLILQAFHASDDLDSLCDGVVRLLCNKFLRESYTESEATARLLHSCAWILLEQDQHEQLEELYGQWQERLKFGPSWDMMRILALSKMEQGLFEEAQKYMLDAWNSLCERGQPMPDRWLKLLGNRAYLSLLTGKLSECRADLERALQYVQCNKGLPAWHKSNIIQLYDKLRIREEMT